MGRRTLADRSWDDVQGYVAAVADALALAADDGDKAVGALQRKVEPLLTKWGTLDGERRARQRAIGRAHALVRRRDLDADGATEQVHIDVLAEVRQDRKAPLYARLFPDGLMAAVKPALEGQLPTLRDLARELKADETPAELRKKHLATIGAVIERGEAAVRAREDAFAEAGRVTARTVSLREDADRVLLGVEGALKALASERRLDARWVDTFFPAPEATQRKKKPAATPEPPPTK